MSLGASLNNALSGLSTAQRSLSVVSSNIANANTDGYTRKQANQATRVIDGIGSGVRSEAANRVVDEFLNAELRRQEGVLARSEAISEIHDRLQASVFGEPGESDRGLSARLNNLAGALEALSNNPNNTANRSSTLSAIEDMLSQIGGDASTVQQMRADVDWQIAREVDGINAAIEKLDRLNGEIARSGGADLLDERDRILGELAGTLDITVVEHENDTIAVYTAGGNTLLEYGPRTLVYNPSASVGEGTTFGAIAIYDPKDFDPSTGQLLPGATGRELVSGGVRAELTPELAADGTADADQIITSSLTTGRLAGLLEARDTVLPGLADQLNELAGMVAFNLNAAHNNAVPYPLPTGLQGSREGLDSFDTATRSGEAYLAITDGTGAVDLEITIDLAAAATPEAVVAQINAQLGARGTAAIDPATDSLSITLGNDPTGEPYRLAISEGSSSITYDDGDGRTRTAGFSHYFGLNDLVVQDGPSASDLAIRPDIRANNRLLSGVMLDGMPGGPAVVGGAGDNRGLQALASALDADYDTISRGGLPATTSSINDYVADVISLQAVDAASAESRAAADRALTEDLRFRQGSVSGVNLDEEMSQLLLFQQAYSVSARVIATINELFDELLTIAR